MTPVDPEAAARRELDAQVAREVMGWTATDVSLSRNLDGAVRFLLESEGGKRVAQATKALRSVQREGAQQLPRYSTDPAAAWKVVEAMRAKGRDVIIDASSEHEIWRVRFLAMGGMGDEVAKGFPAATCRAALAALRGAETTEDTHAK